MIKAVRGLQTLAAMRLSNLPHLILALIFTLAALAPALAGEALFGPEFNFTNNKLIQAGIKKGPTFIELPESLKAQSDFKDLVAKKCPDCQINAKTDKLGYTSFAVKHPDGWVFYISIDPWVVEVQVDPMTEKQIAHAVPEMQRLIFDSAHEIELESQDQAGHIHIGVATGFAESPLLFRNFIVDWISHSRMAFLLFGANKMNAPTIDMLGESSLENFTKLIQLYDESGIWKRKGAPSKTAAWIQKRLRDIRLRSVGISFEDTFAMTPRGLEMSDLSLAINDYVYFKTVAHVAPADKYQNLNLTRMRNSPENQTIELRSVHEMASAHEYLEWARLLQGRINYLEKIRKPIPFIGVKSVSTREAIDDFYEYASKSGMKWKRAAPLMKGYYRFMEPSSPASRAQTCSALFFSAAGSF